MSTIVLRSTTNKKNKVYFCLIEKFARNSPNIFLWIGFIFSNVDRLRVQSYAWINLTSVGTKSRRKILWTISSKCPISSPILRNKCDFVGKKRVGFLRACYLYRRTFFVGFVLAKISRKYKYRKSIVVKRGNKETPHISYIQICTAYACCCCFIASLYFLCAMCFSWNVFYGMYLVRCIS